MVAAAQSVLLDLAVQQVGAPVHAARIQQPRPARAVAEQDQVLAEDAHGPRQAGRLAGQRQRLPIAAQQFAAERALAAAGQILVDVSRRSPIGAAGPVIAAAPEFLAEIHDALSLPLGVSRLRQLYARATAPAKRLSPRRALTAAPPGASWAREAAS